jgi:hypothetical protein
MPSSLPPSSKLEQVAGNLATESALTVVGALAGGPLAPLLPILAKSLAASRQHARVAQALAEVDRTLRAHEAELERITDEQYKLINETVLAVLHTTSEAKLAYLRRAVRNAIGMRDLSPQDSIVLSRIVRDISADEAAFLVANFGYQRVQLATVSAVHEQRVLVINPESVEATVVVGLISLGLLTVAEPTYDDSGLMRFSSMVAKLLVLLNEPAA